jgi:hypothetical protein
MSRWADYDFDALLETLKTKSHAEALKWVRETHAWAKEPIRRRTPQAKMENYARAEYYRLTGELWCFLQEQVKPACLDEHTFQKFLPLAEGWVKTGEMKPSVLDLFGKEK